MQRATYYTFVWKVLTRVMEAVSRQEIVLRVVNRWGAIEVCKEGCNYGYIKALYSLGLMTV